MCSQLERKTILSGILVACVVESILFCLAFFWIFRELPYMQRFISCFVPTVALSCLAGMIYCFASDTTTSGTTTTLGTTISDTTIPDTIISDT